MSTTELLENKNVQEILPYYIVSETTLSADLVKRSVTLPSSEYVIKQVLLSNYLVTEECDISNQVFPNPASDAINVISSNQIDLVVLRDALGKTVKEFNPLSSQFILDISNLKAGHYFLTLNSKTTFSTQKFVIK